MNRCASPSGRFFLPHVEQAHGAENTWQETTEKTYLSRGQVEGGAKGQYGPT
jgi:hypothetical protein